MVKLKQLKKESLSNFLPMRSVEKGPATTDDGEQGLFRPMILSLSAQQLLQGTPFIINIHTKYKNINCHYTYWVHSFIHRVTTMCQAFQIGQTVISVFHQVGDFPCEFNFYLTCLKPFNGLAYVLLHNKPCKNYVKIFWL